MKKKLFVCLLAVVILAVFYGCSVTPSPTMTTGHPSTTDTIPETTEETLPWRSEGLISYKDPYFLGSEPEVDYEINRKVLPEIVENSDGLPILKWVCMLDPYSHAADRIWTETAVVELNQMLADRDLPYRVQFTILSTNSDNDPRDWFAHPDIRKELEDADLIYGFYTYKEMEEWLLPITDYIYGDAQPSLAGMLPDQLSWFSYEVNGEIYAFPDYVPPAYTRGWRLDANFMEKYDLTVEDFNRNFWEMDELFAEIYEKNGNQPFVYNNLVGRHGGTVGQNGVRGDIPMPDTFNSSTYQNSCLCFSIDLQADKPTVVNMLETERFTKTWEAVLRYKKAGYLSTDCNELTYEGYLQSSEPYWNASGEYYIIPCESMGLWVASYTYMTGISAKTVPQEEALSMLERIMTDDALRLQLCYGKEGRDYTLDGNVYSLVIQEDGSNYYMDFLSPQAIFFEFTSADENTQHWVRSTSDNAIVKREGMNRMESYRADLAQASFSNCPVVFDYSALDAELTAIGQVMGDYYPMFTYTDLYEEKYYQEMLEKLEEAGMETVITELQRQLDAWISEHPDWDPLS